MKSLLEVLGSSEATLPRQVDRDKLVECCAAFTDLARQIGLFDPYTAKGSDLQCQEATYEFLLFLRDCFPETVYTGGTREFVFDLSDEAHRAFYPIDVCDYSGDHVVALVGNIAIDWTARQFDPKAPVPFCFIVPMRALS